MKLQRGLRLHIGFFGKRNAGKSTLVNKIFGQNLSIVSSVKGTTTDVNQKAMELLPVGPVVLIDTAGIDDIGDLGKLRIEKTKNAYKKCDIIVFVCDNEPLTNLEKEFLINAKKQNRLILSIINKTDLGDVSNTDYVFLEKNSNKVIKVVEGDFTNEFKNALIEILPSDYMIQPKILPDFIKSNDTVILVIPIDKEAPKGRIILPQVNTLREALDNNILSIVVTPFELKAALNNLKNPPKLVVTDSQAFKTVSEIVGDDILLTSFSILFAKLKGDIETFIQGSNKLDTLSDNNKILILESCTHHPIEDDIARVKIPNLIKKYTKKELIYEYYSGCDFPKNISGYSLIIHCGGCMTNKKEILSRIQAAKKENIPITNYGIVIAKCLNILDKATKFLEE